MEKEIFSSQGLKFCYPESAGFCLSTPQFKIQKEESISIIGPSGGGKSTLLRLIEGSLAAAPSSTINRNGRAVLIYQDLRLVNEKTALQNCLMGALNLDIPKTEKLEKAQDLLEKLGLLNLKDQPVSMLSGGQKQRIAIARALMSSPDLLLADEPFSHLDSQTAIETYSLIKELQKKLKFAWVVTLHQSRLSEFKFDHSWVVRNGNLHLDSQSQNLNAASQTNNPKKIQPIENYFILLFAILTAIFWMQISTQGLNTDSAWSELIIFFKKLVIHNWQDLTSVKWSFLLERLLQTIQIAFLATVFGFLISVPFGFLSAEGIAPRWISRPLRFILMAIRSIPALIWALFFVAGLGLGAISGIAALSVYSVGYFSKLLYEGIEDLERKPYLALRQLGASRTQAMWHALLPSSKPLMVSSFVFLLEYNVRSASLLGLVGAGGIGQDLMYSIEWRDYPTVFGILCLLISIVLIFDVLSAWTRNHIKKRRGV